MQKKVKKDLLLLTKCLYFYIFLGLYPQVSKAQLTLDNVINTLSLRSVSAEIEKKNFQNELLEFENYKKSLLPSVSFSVNPINFNRSLRLLQHPDDGSYSYVEDYSNNSGLGVSVNQKIELTGGELNIGSNLNYLNELSQKRNSFNTTPFSIGYSQQLWGGRKLNKLEKNIEYARNQIAVKNYCSKISQIQQAALSLFMDALLNKLECELSDQIKKNNDSLLYISKVKLNHGNITEYDYKQIELQALNTQYSYDNATKNYVESQQRLCTFLGIEPDNVTIAVPRFNLPLSVDVQTIISYVQKNNPFAVEKNIERMEAEKSLLLAKVNNNFNGNISLNYGVNQYAETLVNAYKKGNIRQSVMIGFKIPVFQWGMNKNRKRMAENSFQVQQLSIDKSLKEFENEIKEKINNYNHSVNLWFTAEKTFTLSQEQYQMLVQKFILGKVSVYELTNAQREQNSAMQQYYNAMKDVYTNYYSLRHLALYDFMSEKDLEYVLIK